MTFAGRSGETHLAAELRDIAAETPCCQRSMHLEIAAQIVEQGQFLHPDCFGIAIELDDAREQLSTQRDSIAAMIEREGEKRGRHFARAGRILADAIRNGFDLPDEPAPAGERARYNDG